MNLNELASEIARRSETKKINLDVTHVKNTLRNLSEVLSEMSLNEAVKMLDKLTTKKK